MNKIKIAVYTAVAGVAVVETLIAAGMVEQKKVQKEQEKLFKDLFVHYCAAMKVADPEYYQKKLIPLIEKMQFLSIVQNI